MAGPSSPDIGALLNEVAGSQAPLTTAQRTAQTLRSAILAGQIARGTQVGESRISAALRVSRNTAREALRLLEAEGLVSHEPYRSPVVTVLEPEDVTDVFAVRLVLELGAIDMIAEREGVDLQPLRRSVERLGRLVGSDDQLEVLETDREFHACLVAAANSPRLSAAYARIESEIRLCLSISTRSPDRIQELADQHAGFLELLEGGRFEEFKLDLRAHLDVAVERVARVLAESKDTTTSASPSHSDRPVSWDRPAKSATLR